MAAKVIVIGAGPGDPDLITVKGLKYLQQADVVITDRLVSEQLLEEVVKPEAEIILAGKEAGSSKSVAQQRINDLLVEHYFQNKLVVRLKGGDVAFFSNALDELITLVRYDIPYEIVPGITAAAGASAYAGIPLTARGYADSVRFITFHHNEGRLDSYWKELAETNDTLVLYMSGNNLRHVAANLINQNISADKSIAVIEQATTPFQRVRIYQFDEYMKIGKHPFKSPSLVLIGKVVALHEYFSWFKASDVAGNYFRSADDSLVNPHLVKI